MITALPIPAPLFDEAAALAWEVQARAYAPYSKFHVGAVLIGTNDEFFAGCNVENLSFGLTICAERVALGAAVAQGVRTFKAVVVVSDSQTPVSPCGACRQVLAEFNPDLPVISVNRDGERFVSSLTELLPRASTGILG